ncbi:MAG: hypothetical protein K9I68_11985 [Bacteroidales bacterium]|nr:hypothetical protein [Bacteroidales bacterium]
MKRERKIVTITIIIALAILVLMTLHDIATRQDNLTGEYVTLGISSVIFVILASRLYKEKKRHN